MDTNPSISVIVPAYNEAHSSLKVLYASLQEQTLKNFEVIIVDDGSTIPDYPELSDPRFRIIFKDFNSGPAASRNRGAAEARAPVIFFTDADCYLDSTTLAHVSKSMAGESVSVGNTVTEASSFLGRAIGYLGFPGGGLLGFHNVWKVDEHGYTNSISSCNLAIRRALFERLGGFDESFPVPAGEDTMLAYTILKHVKGIKYIPEQLVIHEERASLRGFINWQRTRGRGVYHIRRRVGAIGGYAMQRFRSFGRALTHAGPRYWIAVTGLFLLSLFCQWQGFRYEARRADAE